ncbi:helix-turn-helix transcriptional regulator [Roseburia hominis]
MNYKSTKELLDELNSIDTVASLNTFTQNASKYNLNISFSTYIFYHLEKSGLTQAQLIEKTQIQRNYAYQILSGTKNPGRDKVIAICLALSLSLDETQRALTIARESILYPKNKRDSILIFCINKNLSVLETNDLLYEMQEKIL